MDELIDALEDLYEAVGELPASDLAQELYLTIDDLIMVLKGY